MPVNSFESAILIDIAMYMAGTSYSGFWDGLWASYCYSSGVIGILCCIIAVSCICTFLRAIFLIKTDKENKNSAKLNKTEFNLSFFSYSNAV